ncbi:MAG: 3D domain-containing protein, partial [Sarcina sp.]
TLPIVHETIVTNDSNSLDTYSKVLKEGKDGEKEVISRVVFENGKEVSKTVVSEQIKTEPIAKEVVQGTLKTLSVNRGGNAINYTKQLTNVKATAYSPINGAKTAYTASGMKATRNPNGYSTIAVDPSVIPLGTKVYVEGYGYAIAADTGSNVKGNFIDVFFNEYKEACNWGVKYLNVYILEAVE